MSTPSTPPASGRATSAGPGRTRCRSAAAGERGVLAARRRLQRERTLEAERVELVRHVGEGVGVERLLGAPDPFEVVGRQRGDALSLRGRVEAPPQLRVVRVVAQVVVPELLAARDEAVFPRLHPIGTLRPVDPEEELEELRAEALEGRRPTVLPVAERLLERLGDAAGSGLERREHRGDAFAVGSHRVPARRPGLLLRSGPLREEGPERVADGVVVPVLGVLARQHVGQRAEVAPEQPGRLVELREVDRLLVEHGRVGVRRARGDVVGPPLEGPRGEARVEDGVEAMGQLVREQAGELVARAPLHDDRQHVARREPDGPPERLPLALELGVRRTQPDHARGGP